MGQLGGFLKIERHAVPYRDSAERAHDYKRVLRERGEEEELAARAAENGAVSLRGPLDAVGETGA